MTPPCPICEEKLEQVEVGKVMKWWCPRRACNTVFDEVPTRPRLVPS